MIRTCALLISSVEKSDDPLSPDFIPSVFFLFVGSPVKRKQKQALDSYERRSKRQSLKVSLGIDLPEEEQAVTAQAEEPPGISSSSTAINESDAVGCPHVVELEEVKLRLKNAEYELQLLRAQVKKLKYHNRILANRVGLTEDDLICNDEKVKLYTGLPSYALLMVIFEVAYKML